MGVLICLCLPRTPSRPASWHCFLCTPSYILLVILYASSPLFAYSLLRQQILGPLPSDRVTAPVHRLQVPHLVPFIVCPSPWPLFHSLLLIPASLHPALAWGPAMVGAPQSEPLSLVSLLRAPTAAAQGTPPSTTCVRARCCVGLAGSRQTRPRAAQGPKWAAPSPPALLPPASPSPAATAVWGAVGVEASGTAWSPVPTSWATPVPAPR